MSSSQLPEGGRVPLRVDAERNRADIVRAARSVFAEAGMDVPTGRIARRAGVSVATLYRRYPTREALIEAAFVEHHAACSRFLAAAERHPDPWSALCTAVRRFCADQVHDRGFTTQLLVAAGTGATAPAGIAAEFAPEAERLDALLRRARDSGAVRADVGLTDLYLLVAGHAGVVAAAEPTRSDAASRRYVDLILRSFETTADRGGIDTVPAA